MKGGLVLLAAAVEDENARLRELLRWAVKKIDQEVCIHEEVKRGGAIWTICCGCGAQWADDRGGFTPYSEPKELAEARAILEQS